MLKKLLLAVAILGIIAYFISEASSGQATAYRNELQQFRREKNRNFRLSPESPLSVEQRQQFDSLKYYPVVPELRVTATLTRNARPQTVTLQMSDTLTEQYLSWGLVRFTINQQPQTLTLFQKASGRDSTLFVPFTDLSNGRDTYGGGRYLDVPLPPAETSTIELDFNRAYNPYCAYNDGYSCPVPPAENRLKVAIPAGEKSFHD